MMEIVAFAIGFVILAAYFYSRRLGKPIIMDMGNAVGGVLLVPMYLLSGAWFVLPLTIGFTLVGFYGIGVEKALIRPQKPL